MASQKKRPPLLPQVLCGFLLSFTVFVFAPVDMIMLNSANFWFSPLDFLATFSLFFAVAFAAIELVFLLIRRFLPYGLYMLLLALLFGVTLAIYVQGNYLCMDNSVLLGGAPEWSLMVMSTVRNLLAWVAIILIPLCVMVVKPKLFLKAVPFVCGLVLVMEGVALTAGIIHFANSDSRGRQGIYYSDKDHFTFSENGDVLVFMLDTYDTRIFEEIRARDADYLKQLDGFTYYRNASSSYRCTDASFVSMLTGELYLNEETFFEYTDNAFTRSQFFSTLHDNGLTVGIYGNAAVDVFSEATMTEVDNLRATEAAINNMKEFVVIMYRMVGYRYAPKFMQPFVYMEFAEVLDRFREIPETLPDRTVQNDDMTIRAFREKGVTIDNDRRFFKFYTLQGAHSPYRLTRNGDPVPNDSVGRYEQALGSLHILNEMLQGLKDAGLYDKSTILILADHGYSWTSNPTLLVKYPGEKGDELKLSDAPVCLLDIRATALYGAGIDYEDFGRPVHLWEGETDRERIYYAYEWAAPNRFEFYLHNLTEYLVPQDATDLDAYQATGRVFAN